jgi:hypothetical protein
MVAGVNWWHVVAALWILAIVFTVLFFMGANGKRLR